MIKKPFLIYVKFLPFNYSGISIYPFIFIQKNKKTYKLIKHEYIHFKQAKRNTAFLFFLRYLFNLLIVGYSLNPFELEANGSIKPQIKTKLN